MNARVLLVAAAIVAVTSHRVAAQDTAPSKWADTISAEIDRATLAGDAAKLDAAVALAARVAAAYPNDGLIQHYHGYALYRSGILQASNGANASAVFEQAATILERSLKTHPMPETHVLLSSIDGQLIAADPSRAMELGMASQASADAAISMGPSNPRVWLVRGQGAMFTPSEYGGGLDVAKSQLERAVQLFAKDAPKPGEPSWGKAEAYAWLGLVYERRGDKTRAASSYKQALAISPDYAYAKRLASALK